MVGAEEDHDGHTYSVNPTCVFCGDVLFGGPGGWWSMRTTLERCAKSTTTGFHEVTK